MPNSKSTKNYSEPTLHSRSQQQWVVSCATFENQLLWTPNSIISTIGQREFVLGPFRVSTFEQAHAHSVVLLKDSIKETFHCPCNIRGTKLVASYYDNVNKKWRNRQFQQAVNRRVCPSGPTQSAIKTRGTVSSRPIHMINGMIDTKKYAQHVNSY